MLGILDVAAARELITFLALFASALAIALAGDHGVTASFTTDASRSNDEINRCHAILNALGVVFYAAGMQ
jgi:hypothetical protein